MIQRVPRVAWVGPPEEIASQLRFAIAGDERPTHATLHPTNARFHASIIGHTDTLA